MDETSRQTTVLEPIVSRVHIEWEESVCPSCGGADWSPLLEAPDRMPGSAGLWFMVVACASCGTCYTNPRPTPSCMHLFQRSPFPAPAGATIARQRRPWGKRLQGNSLLIVNGQPDPMDLSGELFDTIALVGTLEQTHQPAELLHSLRTRLSAEGRLIVRVPNIASFGYRWFGTCWEGLNLPRHLTHFTPATLRHLLKCAGYQCGRARMIRRSSWMRGSARRWCRQSLPTSTWLPWLQLKPFSRLAGWGSFLFQSADEMEVTATKSEP